MMTRVGPGRPRNLRAMLGEMRALAPSEFESVRDFLTEERPGPLVGQHVLATGNGSLWVDRLPGPRAVLARTAGNWSLAGEPEAIDPGELPTGLPGMIDAPDSFLPLLRSAFADLKIWDRVILHLPAEPATPELDRIDLRPLRANDAQRLAGLDPQLQWISETWEGPKGIASSGRAWGALLGEKLVSVAVSFFVGTRHEDIGVVTNAGERGRSLSAACAGRLSSDIRARRRKPSWSTSPDNRSSLRVAEKLGFEIERHDRLYVTGQEIPKPAMPGPGPRPGD